MKQTAVEWLIEQLADKGTLHSADIAKAKEMEKSQIINAHREATLESGFEYSADDWANDYWNNNYKNK